MIDQNDTLSHTYDAFLFSIAKLADALGVTRDTVRKRLARVEPAKQRNGFDVYHLRDCVQLIEDEFSTDPDQMRPRDRKDWYEGEYRRIDIAKRNSELIPAEEIRQVWAETLKSIMLMLDTLVDVVERDVGLNLEQIARIQSIIDAQRESLYQELCTQAHRKSLAS